MSLQIDDYTQTLELAPNFARAYYNRGQAYQEIDELDLAIDGLYCRAAL